MNKKGLLLIVALLIVVALFFVAVAVWYYELPKTTHSPSVATNSIISTNATMAKSTKSASNTQDISGKIALLRDGDIWIADEAGHQTQLTNTGGNVGGPVPFSLSPDFSYLGFTQQNSGTAEYNILDLTTDQIIRTVTDRDLTDSLSSAGMYDSGCLVGMDGGEMLSNSKFYIIPSPSGEDAGAFCGSGTFIIFDLNSAIHPIVGSTSDPNIALLRGYGITPPIGPTSDSRDTCSMPQPNGEFVLYTCQLFSSIQVGTESYDNSVSGNSYLFNMTSGVITYLAGFFGKGMWHGYNISMGGYGEAVNHQGSEIVYTSPDLGGGSDVLIYDIYLASKPNYQGKVVSTSSLKIENVSWSDDDKYIAFLGSQISYPYATYIIVEDSLGFAVQKTIRGDGSRVAWTRNNSLLFERGKNLDIYSTKTGQVTLFSMNSSEPLGL